MFIDMLGSLFYSVDRTHLRMVLNYGKINTVSSCGITQKSHRILIEASAIVGFHMTNLKSLVFSLPGSLFYPALPFHAPMYPYIFP